MAENGEVRRRIHAARTAVDDIEPVSYTHLDVYKRQLEDFYGDMDFKVAGTKKGITAIQMDLKVHGLTPATVSYTHLDVYKRQIPPETDYNNIDGLRLEAREKLSKIRPKMCIRDSSSALERHS